MKPLRRLTALMLACQVAAGAVCFAAEPASGDAQPDDPTLGASQPEDEEEPILDEEPDPTLGESSAGADWIEVGNVSYPSKFQFTIDPYQINGREQVYSEYISVVNNNRFPVEVELLSPVIVPDSPDVFVLDQPVDLFAFSPDKEICLYLRRVDQPGKEILLGEKAPKEPIRFTLGASDGSVTIGESGENEYHLGSCQAIFEIVGTVSVSPEEPWRAGDVSVNMSFAAYREVFPEKEREADPASVDEVEPVEETLPEADPEEEENEWPEGSGWANDEEDVIVIDHTTRPEREEDPPYSDEPELPAE